MDEYVTFDNERDVVYKNWLQKTGEPCESLDKLREAMLLHLAQDIVIKEHKIRYQKEQYDRYIYSCANTRLKARDLTLAEFAHNYAELIESEIRFSHNMKCPKIESNYDDFGEKTVRPLNAAVFYYFFSGSRTFA